MFPGSMTETRPLAEFKRLKMVALFIWRCDNRTEFKNKDVIEFCGSKGIKREYSNARTPQQNGVAKRKTMTLIEAARTMLADSFLPNTFWAEAVILLVILKRQEKDANKAAEALRKEFAQETENLIIQAGAAKATKISKALEDESWVDAMQEELLQFNIQKVWILVDLPFCKKAIGTKWVYRNKKDERGFVVRNKARLVAQRHRKEEGINYDEVFAPVAMIEAIRIFLAFASYMGFIVYQMDVKSAFLYGKIDEENSVYHSKTKHIAIRHHFIRDAYEKKLIQVLKIHTDDNVADLLTNAFDVSRHMYAKSSAASNESISEASIRSDLLFNDANGIDSLPNQAIFDAIRHLWDKQLANVPVPLDHFPVNALTSKVFSFMVKKGKHFSGKVTPLFASMLVQPTEDEGAPSERPSEAQPTPSPIHTSEVPLVPQTDPSPTHTSEVPVEPQTDPSPRPSPSTTIPDSIPESSGGNLGGHSSSDKSLSGNEGEMTLQSVYDLCLSLCAQVSDQAKEIQHLKAQIKKLKKQAKPVVKHHRAWMKSVSLKQRLARKRSSKKQWVHKESVSKQGRKFAKGEPSVHKDPLFDEIPEDTLDNIETENAQDVGRTRDIVGEEKENDEDVLSTDKEKVSNDRPIVSTDGSKVSTDRQNEGTDDQIEGTDEQSKGTDDHTKEGSATQTTQTPTSTIFGDDETIAKVLFNTSQAKAVSREKEKGVEFKDIEETDRPRPTSTRSLLTLKPLPKIDPKDKGKKKIEEEDESDDIPEAEKKFKQLASDEEMARKIQEEWEGEEERNRLAEEKATNEALIRNYDDIKARIEADRLLAEKLQEEEREQFTIEERAKFLHDTIAAQRKFLA
ncbi:putative ribonuclease H-like domain-containing protein [Tanacetum coccineum]